MGTTTCRLHLYLTGTTSVSSHAHTCSHTLTQTQGGYSWHIKHVKCTLLTHTYSIFSHHDPPRPVAEAWVPPLGQFQSQLNFCFGFVTLFFLIKLSFSYVHSTI